VIASFILIDLSQFQWLYLAVNLTSVIIATFYAVLIWNLRGPFRLLHGLQDRLYNTVFYFRKRKQKGPIDIATGKPQLDDDHFIDAMLEKISRTGSRSLTWQERKRMDEISKRKAVH
jgi:hypothetical protein